MIALTPSESAIAVILLIFLYVVIRWINWMTK